MSVRREPWGSTRAGEPVELVTLDHGRVRARCTNFGATLVSLEVPDRAGELGDVVLGFDSLAEYESERNPYCGGVVGRCANRIGGARFTLDGREVRLTANEGANHLHGGARGFDRRLWTTREARGSSVHFDLHSADGDEGYPGALDVSAGYHLGPVAEGQSTFVVGVQLLAHVHAPTPCSPTQHGYFNLAGSGSVLDHTLEVFASRYVVVDAELVPTGELASVAGTPFDFRRPRRIGARIAALEATPARGYDVCFVLDGAGWHAPAARLHDPRSGRTLEIHTQQPGLQLYTGNRLDGLRGKRGARHERFAGACLETQGLPDAVNHPHFPSVVLRPHAPAHFTTVWLFSAE